jgi:hypothetical protein
VCYPREIREIKRANQMQLLLTNDAMTTSLISGGWEYFCFFQVFFYFILRHLRHKALITKPSILISYDKGNKFASFCVIDLSYQINDYIYTPN